MYGLSRWRVAVLAVLVLAPVVFLAAIGGYNLWLAGWSFRAWWFMAGSLAAAYFLGLYWHRKKQLLPPVDFTALRHWTERDRAGWQVIEAKAREAGSVAVDELSEISFYTATAQELAWAVARAYHPSAKDPLGPLTIPELLAVAELASHDLAEMVDTYLPGGHFLTINDWRRARQATDWYATASKFYWMAAALFAPMQTGVRFAATQLGLAMPLQQLQQNLLLWFYTAFLQRLGTYLIELNSGRLRIGARRYREIMAAAATAAPPPTTGAGTPTAPVVPMPLDPAENVQRVTITLFGQVKAGKSSLINALLGEQQARTAVVPMTAEVTRYELHHADVPTRLVLLDTVGYHHKSARADQQASTADAVQHSDLVFLVLHATTPARQADLEFLTSLRAWFKARPELKMPPILGVLTHIDLLPPSLEWAPPYHWQQPKRAKEHSLNEALEVTREQLGQFLVGLVPVCAATAKVYGVEEFLLPAISELLEEARAVALLRVLRAEADTARVRKVIRQLLATGTKTAKLVWQNYSQV